MAKEPKPYTRLTRAAGGLGTYTSLWLGSDHLMIVTSTGYGESYARLQLRDVKGFFITKSDRRMWWRLVWAVPATICLIIAVVAVVNGEVPVFSAIFFALTGTGLVWNEIMGPGCHAFVVTGVQTAKLPSMVRQKKARRVLGRLQPLIEAAQADLVIAAPPVFEAPPIIAPPPVAAEPPVTALVELPPVVAPAPPAPPPSA